MFSVDKDVMLPGSGVFLVSLFKRRTSYTGTRQVLGGLRMVRQMDMMRILCVSASYCVFLLINVKASILKPG